MMINSHNNKSEVSEKLQIGHDYMQALELERQKVLVFQRELPLCLQLVTHAIETCKQQITGTTTSDNNNNNNGQLLDECCEQTSSPVFEEFIPIKRVLSSHCDDDEEQESNNNNNNNNNNSKKSEWLKSVQLWNQTPDPPSIKDPPRKSTVLKVKRNGAFHPLKKEKNVGRPAPPPSASSTADTGGNKKGGHSQRNNKRRRRCWSPELHKRFLQSLQQLGGSHVATPKQIRELMKVDGLTNDEVKSHLQKYRLNNTRIPNSSTRDDNNNNNTQPRQFVVVGGIWVPQEYTSVAPPATTKINTGGGRAAPKGIYALVPSLPPPFQETLSSTKQRRSNSDDRGDDSELGDEDQSYSPATSSSSGHKTNV